MLNRIQLNRSLSLQFNGLTKDGQSQSPIIDTQSSSNLSPSIQPDSIQSFSALISLNEQERLLVDSSSNEDLTSNSQLNSSNNTNDDLSKRCIKKGDYILFEPNGQADSFSTAYNAKNKKILYWKRFDEKDYMKKLEPYFIMDGASDKIYKFKEIILDSNLNSSNSIKNAYVFFDQHYGDLHSYMKEKKRLDETEAKHIYRQCVQAVLDCHENGIIIRDIKLKKFVFLDQEKTQLGLANLEDCLILDEEATDDLIKSQQGCPAYVSPEVLNPSQTSYSGRLSDSWSLGIILYTLLIGRYPFHHPTITNMFAKIARGRFQIPPSISLSLEAKLLLRSLIRVKPEERLLPSEILAHCWLKQTESENLTKKSSFESRFSSSSQVYKIPLGISLSAPGRLTNNNKNYFGKQANKIINNFNDDEDRLVPEFKF
ncbi:unnamed protein product [Brachionus calyciflorus]|uniref:Protein kinase domain-containing protein n=1 Tax=Brachionus calyciflorus TaxID=104777 RepID=A0A814HBN5_9BILA|nr:unnamed protein product [Brachionus calyciflorus]